MKTRYKFIHFVFEHCEIGEGVWTCRNNKTDTILGGLDYAPRWRQFVFSADEDAVFSADCLRDIAEFIDALKAEKPAEEEDE